MAACPRPPSCIVASIITSPIKSDTGTYVYIHDKRNSELSTAERNNQIYQNVSVHRPSSADTNRLHLKQTDW